MSNHGVLTGKLSEDSPQLAGALKRTFTPEISRELTELYSVVWKTGGCNEITPRREGVSYNPRPARICCILIQDGQCRDKMSIETALQSCCESDIDSAPPLVQIAHDIDTLRHLHLVPLDSEAKRFIVDKISARSTRYTSCPERLLSMFKDTLARHTGNEL